MFVFQPRVDSSKSISNESQRFNVFLNNITVHCYRHLVQHDRSDWEKLKWFCVNFVFAVTSITIILQSWTGFTSNPLVTKLHNTLYPSSSVPFPGVSICNINRISKNAAEDLASELSKADKVNQRSIEYFMQQILHFGSLYSYDYADDKPLLDFQSYLDEVYEGESFTIINDLMKRLTPACEDMFLKCYWRSKEYQCIEGKDMFVRRRTQYGHCCSFNYVIQPGNVIDTPRFSDYTGPDMGLVLSINGTPSDYYYPLHMSTGFVVLVHNPFEFPDSPSGGVNEIPVMLERETLIRVDATTITADPYIINYSPKTRHCLFPNELAKKYGGKYARSQCMVHCRLESVLALCECIPFTMPVDIFFFDNGTSKQICNLVQVSCLNKYRIKWLTMSTEILNEKGLEKEREESLYCQDCLPSCFDTKYTVSSTSLPLQETKRKGNNIMQGIKNVSEISLIRVYFGQPETWQFMQSVQLEWYEILSNFGGIFGILLGFSMLSATEIIYFIVKEIFLYFFHKWHLHKLDIDDGLIICP